MGSVKNCINIITSELLIVIKQLPENANLLIMPLLQMTK